MMPCKTQIREVVAGLDNMASTSDLTVHLGLGLARSADVWVNWPSGRETGTLYTFDNPDPDLRLNRFHVVTETEEP